MADLAASAWSVAAEDAELVSAVREGSYEAFDRLVQLYQSSVYNVVYRIVGDPNDTADTVQEVFLKVFRGIGKFQGQSSLKTWIFRIAFHEGCNQRRWWRRHRFWETSLETWVTPDADGPSLGDCLMEDGASPFEEVARSEMRRLLDRALAEIPHGYRAAVVLRDLEELSYEEIAEVMDVSLGTVKSRVARGREALRAKLAGVLSGSGVAERAQSMPLLALRMR